MTTQQILDIMNPKKFIRIAGVLLLAVSICAIGDFYHIHTRAIDYSTVTRESIAPADTDTFYFFPPPEKQYVSPVDPLEIQLVRQLKIIFPFFITVFLGMAVIYALLSKVLSTSIEKRLSTSHTQFSESIEPGCFFMALYFLSGFGNAEPYFLFIVFTIIFIGRLFTTYDRVFVLILSLIVGVSGAFYEGAICLVPYRNALLFDAPIWLGPLYMNGVFAFRAFYRYAVYDENQ